MPFTAAPSQPASLLQNPTAYRIIRNNYITPERATQKGAEKCRQSCAKTWCQINLSNEKEEKKL